MPFLNGKQPLVKKQCIEKALLIRIALCVQEVGASGCLGKGRGDLWLTSVGFFQTQSIGSFFLFFLNKKEENVIFPLSLFLLYIQNVRSLLQLFVLILTK